MSQERQMMSSSWSGDQRQRLGASLVMPPPSQTNTLRKQVPNVDVSNVTIAGEEILKYFLVKHFLTFPFQFTHSAMKRVNPCLIGSRFQPRMLL